MNVVFRFLLIPLLLATIVSLGVARAEFDRCPPDCTHDHANVMSVSSCCDDIDTTRTTGTIPAQVEVSPRFPGCYGGALCVIAGDTGDDALFLPSGGWNGVAPEPATIGSYPVVPVRTAICLQFMTSPPMKQPDLYTLNCSLLI